MIKNDLVNEVLRNTDLTQETAMEVTNTIISAIAKSLCRGESVSLRGLGTFKVVKRKPKCGRDILRNKKVDIPMRNGVKFIAGKVIKDKFKQH